MKETMASDNKPEKLRKDGTPVSRMGRRLTVDEEQQIIEWKLNRMSVVAIAEQLDCHQRTVKRVWNKHLDSIAEERHGKNERNRIEAIQRLDQIAVDARHGALRARKDQNQASEHRFLTLEEKTLLDIARLDGLQVDKVEVSGGIGVVAVHITEQVEDTYRQNNEVIDVETDD